MSDHQELVKPRCYRYLAHWISQIVGLVRGVAHLAKEGERILIGGQGLLVAFHRVQGVADIKKALCLLLLIVRQAAVEF